MYLQSNTDSATNNDHASSSVCRGAAGILTNMIKNAYRFNLQVFCRRSYALFNISADSRGRCIVRKSQIYDRSGFFALPNIPEK
ncbi:hypothetical protein CHH92_19600 [Bacillus sonorensis]|uniref:Uncharacterized protein n=1 Tax=Bacillus sonorensis L12 TaxID=1274524 RepID=M5PBK9_9BACI|nr:hypothetical protein BSONL12_15089 [Bacillus sonorensis L12]MBG9914079.1 hypothetical protein [Bacillus sonorensis]PAD58393.1 hypothetical protein CHH92_19600 [Bacillus sonorensis]RHJ08190.1 hypothetical protein DW143_15660 [Bacillus sonorensis]TWK79326.1 hypothetical protein CHCC20335_0103 [Bacillus paralicheniformis]